MKTTRTSGRRHATRVFNAKRRPARLALLATLLLSLLFLVSAATETLNVATCTPQNPGSCNVAGLNSDDTLADGASIPKGKTVTTTWSDTTFTAGSTITKVELVATHGGEAGINNNLEFTLQSVGGATQYCTFAMANVQAQTKETNDTTATCAWTQARLDDLEIVVRNGATAKARALLSFLDIVITYTPPDTTEPTVELVTPDNRSWDLDGDLTLVYKPTEDRGFDNCTLFFDGSYNQTNSTPIENNTNNNFTLSSVPDGNHTWYVNCSDTSGNSNVSETRQVRIDTTGPNVSLEAPEHNNVTANSEVTFYYNVSDEQTNISSCTLYTNGTERDTTNDPAEGTSLNFTVVLANAKYAWWVNCTDGNGFTTKSEERNITVNSPTPTVVPGAGTYVLGQTASVTGENWGALVELTVNYTLSNGTNVVHAPTTLADGTFSDTLTLNYSFPVGAYNVSVYETLTPAQNASSSFTVNTLSTTLSVTPDPVAQGNQVTMTGTDFSPNCTVNVTLTYNDSSTYSFLVDADANGDFTSKYNLSYTVPLDRTTAFAYDVNYSKFNDSDTFTIINRSVEVETNDTTYLRNANVLIEGWNFTRLGEVEVRIYDNNTEDLGSSFPANDTNNDSGYFNYTWNTGDTCNGVYRVEVVDWNNSFLNDTNTTFFTIDETTANSDSTHATSGTKQAPPNAVTAITVSNVNQSDGTPESLSANDKTTWYFTFNFTSNYNRGLSIESVVFLIEHAESAGDFGTLTLDYWNGSVWQSTGCGLTNDAGYHNETCDLSSYYTTPESLDTAAVRFNLPKTSGPLATASVDYVELTVNTSYEPSCTYFNGTTGGGLAANPPFISLVILDDNVAAPANELDLVAGTTQNIWCNVTASDNDGYTDIDSVTGVLYHSSVLVGDPDDNQNHYSNASCSLLSGSGVNANYNCSFDVWYYALNGTWTCSATADDGTDTSTKTGASSMNALYALNVTPTTVNYGNLSEGETSTEQEVNVSNIGNTAMNVNVYGYGVAIGDGLSFDCAQENITRTAERYSTSSGTYDTKLVLPLTFTDLGITVTATTDGTESKDSTYWQLRVPTTGDPYGVCNGNIVFQADSTV